MRLEKQKPGFRDFSHQHGLHGGFEAVEVIFFLKKSGFIIYCMVARSRYSTKKLAPNR